MPTTAACGAPAADVVLTTASLLRRTTVSLQGPAVLAHDRLPPRFDPDRDRGPDRARRGERLHRRGDRGSGDVHGRQPGALPRRRLPDDDRRSAGRGRPGRVRNVDRRAAATTSASTRRPTPNTTGRSTASWWARTSSSTPPSSRRPSTIEVTDHPATAGPAVDLDAHRRVVRLPDQPARDGHGAGDGRRIQLQRAARWAPTIRSSGRTRRRAAAARSTRRWGTRWRATPTRSSAQHLAGAIRWAAGL